MQKQFFLRVVANTPQPLYINTGASLGYTQVGGGIGTFLNAQGGTPPYTWTLDSGTLPPGVRLVGPGETVAWNYYHPGGTYLQGTAMLAGTYNFTLKVADSASHSTTKAFTLVVPILAFDNTSLPFPGTTLVYGSAYSQPMVVLGGSGSYPTLGRGDQSAAGPRPGRERRGGRHPRL